MSKREREGHCVWLQMGNTPVEKIVENHIIYWWFGCCVTSAVGVASLDGYFKRAPGEKSCSDTCRCCTEADARSNNNSEKKEVRREAAGTQQNPCHLLRLFREAVADEGKVTISVMMSCY